eukprot:jgi/Bigna1/84727/fgenesh1_pg.248_\
MKDSVRCLKLLKTTINICLDQTKFTGKFLESKQKEKDAEGQAASLLSGGGGSSGFGLGGSGGSFGGFGALASSSSSSSPVPSPQYAVGFETGEVQDTEVAFCLRKLSKRDPVTKLKALQELEKVFKGKTSKELKEVVAGWSYSFNLASLENDKKVRAALYDCMRELIKK